MSVWRSYEFAGIVPRLRPKQLPKGFATVAHDVDLTHGTLKAFLEPRHITTAPPDAVHMHLWGSRVLTWNTCVNVCEWLPDEPRLFITGNAPYPQTITLENGKYVYRRLGVPAPPSAPTPRVVAAHNDAVFDATRGTDRDRNVAYMVTFVNAFGEEGGASLPSYDVVIEDGQAVQLTFSYAPHPEYDVRRMRIYRRETGFITGEEKEQTLDTHWFFLAELDISAKSFTDTTKIMNLGWAFENLDTREPPAELTNITLLPETAILAGSVKNKLLFSRNLQPNNWELSQELTLDDNIVAIGGVGDKLYVATDGHPYVVQADNGGNNRASRSVHRYKQAFPMINCHIGHGAVTTPFGFIYASTDGLVCLAGGDPEVITSDMLSADDWRQLAPHTARLAYSKGALYVVTDKISFVLWLDSRTYADTKYKKLVTISDEPIDMVVSRQGELLFLQPTGDVVQWNAGTRLRPYRWVSAIITTGCYFDLTRAKATVLNASTRISITCEKGSISRDFPTGTTNIPFGRHGLSQEFVIEATGTGEVTEIVAGLSEIDMGDA